ncbi:MAG: DUF1540 domain-containing protein [Candidatus Omnitrophica bacterium]|nr:DUF1540 domain-containing protein [Candidatus Omnitrophota bacterium]
MDKKMPKVTDCEVAECAYNNQQKCHALAITIGDGDCPACDTEINQSSKGGFMDITGGVGACKVSQCAFNQSLECSADSINVRKHSGHAECNTYKAK